MAYHGFKSYSELVLFAMKSENNAELWHAWLKQKQMRDMEEQEIIREVRKKHPGLTVNEILFKYKSYLDSNFIVPTFE